MAVELALKAHLSKPPSCGTGRGIRSPSAVVAGAWLRCSNGQSVGVQADHGRGV